MEFQKLTFVMDFNRFLKENLPKNLLEKWHSYMPEDANEDDFSFIIHKKDEWNYFWGYGAELLTEAGILPLTDNN